MSNRRLFMLIAGLGALMLIAPVGCSVVGIRTVEEPDFTVLEKSGSFELREYDQVVVVATTVEEDYDDAGNTAFFRLFDYISGDNRSQKKIPMTAPVMADSSDTGEKIPMTAPVVSEQAESGWRFMFVLPSEYTLETAPVPTSPLVELLALPPTRVAALRYSGSWGEEPMRARAAELLAWVDQQGLETKSSTRSAGYDPPWTLPFLRRNEVLVEVE